MPGNYSSEIIQAYLATLQEQTIYVMIPSMIYLAMLSCIGICGNSLVLFVYLRKFSRTEVGVFIMVMACSDLLTNVVVIPGEIYDMFHAWDFNNRLLCQARLFVNATAIMASALLLLAISITRYRKICVPFGKQVTLRHAQIFSCFLVTMAALFSVPYALINGIQIKNTTISGIHGTFCSVDEGFVTTIWPMVNSAFFILLFLLTSAPLVVLYIMIGIKAKRHGKFQDSKHKCKLNNKDVSKFDERSRSTADELSTSLSQCDTELVSFEIAYQVTNKLGSSSLTMSNKNKTISTKRRKTRSRRNLGRTTCMLLTISLIYILGFLPFLALECFKSAAPESFAAMDAVSLSLYHLFLRSYLLNSAANPVVYSLCDLNFRRELKKLGQCT
ncbi:kappa-type opioid receptor-like [Physella acuta]|uniref:kappa-type opioid receptor-like n=1 Tax=Physella acuta TaxID=109671 RepID=UPI0027DCA01B|nr:kappa-type opioid receptor-like [Physella acuta]